MAVPRSVVAADIASRMGVTRQAEPPPSAPPPTSSPPPDAAAAPRATRAVEPREPDRSAPPAAGGQAEPCDGLLAPGTPPGAVQRQTSLHEPPLHRVNLSFRLDNEHHLRLRLAAAHLRKSSQKLLEAALDYYLETFAPACARGGHCLCMGEAEPRLDAAAAFAERAAPGDPDGPQR